MRSTRENMRSRTAPTAKLNVGHLFGGLFAIVGFAILAGVWIPVWNDHRQRRELGPQGALAAGMVLSKTRKRVGTETVLGYTRDIIEYSVRYRYTTSEGKRFENTASISRDERALLEERGFIKVRYLPANPPIAHVPGELRAWRSSARLVFSIVGALFSVVGTLVLVVVLKVDRKRA
jgi:hypothetical protein